MVSQPTVEEALALLRQALSATDEALAISASLDQLQERFETIVQALIDEPEVLTAAQKNLSEAKTALFNARGCLEEMLSQIAQDQSPEVQSRAWADQFVDLNERLQAALTNASQQATRLYEMMRPSLIKHYLQNATRVPRWGDTWPVDFEMAVTAIEHIAASNEAGLVEELDVQLARFRWEVGWPQHRIAAVVGLSQPSVAARLARIEAVISLEMAAKRVREQADKEQFRLIRGHSSPGRASRGPVADIVLENNECVIELELLVAAGQTGTARRSTPLGHSAALDYFRLQAAERRQRAAGRIVNGLAVYFREKGFVGYYTIAELADAVRRLGGLPVETVLQRLRESVEPARTLAELLLRAECPATTSQHPEA